MPSLTPCPSCHVHIKPGDSECPHCGTALRTTSAVRTPAVLLGLALTACPTAEPAYGVPATSGPTTGPTSGGTTTGETESGTDTTSAGSGSGSTGMNDTGTTTGNGTTAGTSATSSTDSAGEADYGVPETETI